MMPVIMKCEELLLPVRMTQPNITVCFNYSPRYTLMLQCWEMERKSRPTFSDLVSSLSQSLEAMVGYMDVGAFGQVDTMASESGFSEPSKDHNSSEKEPSQSKADECEEVKLELTSVNETSV